MPDLQTCLAGHDLAFLRNLADLWGVTVRGRDVRTYAVSLAHSLLDEGNFRDEFISLPKESQNALTAIKHQGASMPWTSFTREYGELRTMGPAKREREKPHLFPISATERLWYRGMIGRAFIRHEDSISEVAYIPAEFLAWLPETEAGQDQRALVNLPGTSVDQIRSSTFYRFAILDDACTLLAALRQRDPFEVLSKSSQSQTYWMQLTQLLKATGLIDPDGQTPAEAARTFLEKPRREALVWLATTWFGSRKFQELKLTPGIKCEGTWQYDAAAPRQFLLRKLESVNPQTWISLDALIEFFNVNYTDFLRQGGDYESWLIIRDEPGSELLRGLESWPQVEGSYLRYLITGPLYFLGLIELGYNGQAKERFFRRSAWFDDLLAGKAPGENELEENGVTVTSTGLLEMTNLTPRIARYQISRFCEWLEIGPKRFQFRLTPTSLAHAKEQGLTPRHLVSLLRKYGTSSPSPTFIKAIHRWEEEGREALIEQPTILRLSTPEMLQALRESPAGKFLGDSLGPVTVILKAGSEQKVQTALARLGYLADINKGKA